MLHYYVFLLFVIHTIENRRSIQQVGSGHRATTDHVYTRYEKSQATKESHISSENQTYSPSG